MEFYDGLAEYTNSGTMSAEDGSISQLQQGTERIPLTEIFDILDYERIPSDPSPSFTHLPTQIPNMMVPVNSMTCEMPLLNFSPTVDTSIDNSYGCYDPHLLANAGVCMYSASRGIAPIETLVTDQSSSLAYPGTFSPSASSSSPSETSIAEDNVFSDLEHQSDDISSPSSSAAFSSSSSSISDARRFASTRASHGNGAYRLPTEISSTAQPPTKFSSKASRGNKRKIDVSEFEDLSLCYHDEEDGDAESSDEDEYRPESADDSDLDARSRRSFASSKRPPPRISTSTDIQPLAKANRNKSHSGSKPRGPAAKKYFLNDGHTNAVGGFVCGLITQWKGKGGQYTSKGIRTPEVGEVCQMRTRNWSDMIRHQEKTFWHSPPGVCQSCQSSLNGRQDNLHRHGLAACKGPMKGKKASSKRPSKKARK